MSKIPDFENFDISEAIVAAGFGMNNIQNFGLGGGTPQTGYSMSPIAGTVNTSADLIGSQAHDYEMNENDDHTADGYITEAKKHMNESIDKAYESCKAMDESETPRLNRPIDVAITEGVMSNINMMAKGAKNYADFEKEFFAEYGHKKEFKKTPAFVKWLKTMYADTVNESVMEADKHEFSPNETAERLKRREQQNIERYRAAQEREDNFGTTYYKYRIAVDKLDLQKLKLMTQIHQLKQKYKK
jgi:hypothetical protein